MGLLGPNADGELPQPGRVPDCYLGLRLDPPAAETPEVLVVAPAALQHRAVPQPDGTVLYELLTGHPDRMPRELVFLADLTVELRAWPTDTWTAVGVDHDQVAQAVVDCWRDGEVTGLQLDDLGFEEARSLTRPAMTYVRGQLRGRLTARLARARRRWLHPTLGRGPDDRSRSHRSRRVTPKAAACPWVSGTWTAWRTAAAEVSGSVCGKSAPVPRGAAGVVVPTGQRPCSPRLAGSWPAVAVVPGLCPAAVPPALPCPRWLPQGHYVAVLVASGRSAAGHPSKGPTAADTSTATESSLSACAGHLPSGRR